MRLPRFRSRRGMTSVLAMMYLALFSTLALGFYATTTTHSQVVANDSHMARAALASETGIDFVRYHLQKVRIPPLTPETMLMDEVYKDLEVLLNGTGTLERQTIGISEDRQVIEIPAATNRFISLEDNGPAFRATLRQDGKNVVATVVGSSAGRTARVGSKAGMELTFRTEQYVGPFFKHGMVSPGTVVVEGSNVVQGSPPSMASVLSTLDANGSVTIGSGIAGDITVITGRDPVIKNGASVGGTSNLTKIYNEHVTEIRADEAPEVPVVDSTLFRPYATTPYAPNQAVYDNVIILPGTNPTFTQSTIRGVLYIQQPNKVTFDGKVDIQGIIVTEDTGTGRAGIENVLSFSGNGGAKSPVTTLPDDPKFDGLRNLDGAFILAPGFHVSLSGNFGNLTGHIVGDSINIAGNNAATITGSAIALEPSQLRIAGSAQLTFSDGGDGDHNGLRFRERLIPDTATYKPVRPW